MKTNRFLTLATVLALGLLAACSTPRLAQNSGDDDVYNTVASARVFSYPSEKPTATTNSYTPTQRDTSFVKSNYQYEMDYSSRIDRFYYGSLYRNYFDDYYNFYDYDTWFNPYRPSWSVNLGWGWNWRWNNWAYNPWHNPFYSSWYYYGAPYHWNTWGPYSYYNPWYGGGYYGNNYWGGNYWGNSVIVRNNENYRPRPNRNIENRIGGRPNGAAIDRNTRGNINDGRTGITYPNGAPVYTPTTQGNSRPTGTAVQDTRPSRGGQSSGESTSRPTRTTTSSPPPSRTSSVGSSSSSSSGSSSSSSSGSSRPTRGSGR